MPFKQNGLNICLPNIKTEHRFHEEKSTHTRSWTTQISMRQLTNFSAWGFTLQKLSTYWACKAQQISATPVGHLDHGIGSNRCMAVWHQPVGALMEYSMVIQIFAPLGALFA